MTENNEPQISVITTDGRTLTPEEFAESGIKIVGPCSTGGSITMSETEECKQARAAMRALWKKHDPTVARTDKAILFEREFKAIIEQCFTETSVRLQVFEKLANGRLEIHMIGVGETTRGSLCEASRHYCDLQRELDSRQGSCDTQDKNVAYEGLWRKFQTGYSYAKIAEDINSVIIDDLARQLRLGFDWIFPPNELPRRVPPGEGRNYALYLLSLFMPENKGRELIRAEIIYIQNGCPAFNKEFPIYQDQVRDRLRYWQETPKHNAFLTTHPWVGKTR